MGPNAEELTALFEILAREAAELRPACRWLIVGPEMATAILGQHARPPTVDDLTRLVRLLEDQAPELMPVGWWLVNASDHAEATQAEIQLDQLIAADLDAWQHPTQVLDRPRPDFELLLTWCQSRRRQRRGSELERLAAIEAKLERAVRIEAIARRRRQRMQGKVRR